MCCFAFILCLILCGISDLINGASFAEREDIERVDIREGETLTLTCKAKPHLLRSYRWVYIREGTRKPRVLSSGRRLVVGENRLRIDAQPADGYVDLILNLHEIRPYEAGLFMCWRQGLKPDPQVYVKVKEKGAVEVEPISVQISAPSHVKYGGTASIKCLITPSWPGKVVWLKNGKKITPKDRYVTLSVRENPGGDVVASLDIVSVREGANYTCQVPSSPPTEASYQLIVKVARIESLTSEPKKDVIEYGEKLTVSCIVSDSDPEILWLKDGASLGKKMASRGLRKQDEVLASGKRKSSLEVVSFSRRHNGQYVCYVPGDSRSILINIEGRGAKITDVKGWDFIVGDALRLTCSTQYNRNKKDVTWLFEGKPLPSDWFGEEVFREDIHNITHHDLSLPIPTSRHVGTYTCTAPFGSASTYVREIVSPFIDESPPAILEVHEGESLELKCSVAGYPVPFTVWEKFIDGHWKLVEEAVSEGDIEAKGIIVKVEALKDKRKKGEEKIGERATLTMTNVTPPYQGDYRCRGANDQEEVVDATQVIVKGPAPGIVQLTSNKIKEGDDLEITCTVKNFHEPVKFLRGFKVLGQGDNPRHTIHLLDKDLHGNTSHDLLSYVLIISKAELEDSATYECLVGSEASTLVEAVIQEAPPTVVEVAASPAVEGGELFVSCTIKNLYTDKEVEFYFDGKNLSEKDSRYSTHLAELKGETVYNERPRAKQATHVLKVVEVVPEDSGQYHCVLDAETRGSVLVEVEVLENIEQVHIQASPAWIGGDLQLRCNVTNWAEEVSFFHNTTMLLEEEDPRYYLSKKKDGNITIHILTIFQLTPQDAGFYQCFTTPFISADVNVTVKRTDNLKVTLEQLPNNMMVWPGAGTEMILDCSVFGFQDYLHSIELSHDGIPYLYVDPYEKGAQVNARVTYIKGSEGDADDVFHLSYKIKLRDVTESDAGTWVCRATLPEAGIIMEDAAKILVYKSPKFLEVPEVEVIVEEGSDLVLNCRATGRPPPEVLWFKDSLPDPVVNQTENAELFIAPFTEYDAGIYKCEATSVNETISFETAVHILKTTTTTTELTTVQQIETELEIIAMPDSEVFVPELTSIELNCTAMGSSPPFVAWFKKDFDEVLASGYDYVIYTIQEFTDRDSGEYTCKASSGGSEASNTTKLVLVKMTVAVTAATEPETFPSTVSPSTPSATTSAVLTVSHSVPTLMVGKLIQISSPPRVEEGGNVTLMCLVSPLLSNFKYVILFEGQLLALNDKLEANDARMTIATSNGPIGETVVTLHIRNLTRADSGEYKCMANTEPVATHSQYIKVVPKVHVIKATTKYVPVVQITRTVVPEVQTRSSTDDESDFWDTTAPFIFPGTISSVTTAKSTDSTFKSTSFDDSFLYEDVEGPTSNDKEKLVQVGQEVSLICIAYISNPDIEPKYFWYYETPERLLFADSDKITHDARFRIEKSNILDEFISTLSIFNVQLKDSGVYGCSLGQRKNFTYEQRLTVFEEYDDDDDDDEDEDSITMTNEIPLLYNYEDEIDEHEHVTERDDDIIDTEISEEDERKLKEKEDKEVVEEKVEEDGDDSLLEHKEDEEEKLKEVGLSKPAEEEQEKERRKLEEDLVDSEKKKEEKLYRQEKTYVGISTSTESTITTSRAAPRPSKADEELHRYMTENRQDSVTYSVKHEESDNVEKTTEAVATSVVDVTESDDNDYKSQKTTTDQTDSEVIADKELTEEESYPDPTEKPKVPGKKVTEANATTVKVDIDKEPESVEAEDDKPKGEKEYYTYDYEEVATTTETSIRVIVGVPGEDVKTPPRAEVVLPCPTKSIPEDITWKDSESLLFLGSLDLAGIAGLALSPEGHLRLLPDVSRTKNGKTYTCLVFDYDTYEDVPVTSYLVELIPGDPITGPGTEASVETYQPPTSTFEFPGLEWQEVAVISNSEMSAKSLVGVLLEGGIKAELTSSNICRKSEQITDWDKVQESLKVCESDARSSGVLRQGQSVFMILDFTVRLPSGKRYGSTLIYVHNAARGIRSHVYGSLVPLSDDDKDSVVECGSPLYSSQSLGFDLGDICKSSVASTILNLQEAYMSESRKLPLV